jgi:hypothetical protein
MNAGMNGSTNHAMRGSRVSAIGFLPLLAVGIATAFAVAGCGQGAKGGCPALPACGGNPVGVWKNIADACSYSPVRPSQPVDVTAFGTITPPTAMVTPPQPNPVVAQQTTSGDWCSSLVYNTDDTVLNVALWHDAPILSDVNITFAAAQGGMLPSYLTSMTFTDPATDPSNPGARNSTHFAHRCLIQNGAAAPTCAKLTTALTNFYMPASPSVPPNFDKIVCTDDGDGGCTCSYVFTLQVSDTGTWASQDTVLLQDSSIYLLNGQPVPSQTPATTVQTPYCVDSGALELTGLRGGSLFGVQGLRTMVLTQ